MAKFETYLTKSDVYQIYISKLKSDLIQAAAVSFGE